VPFADELLRKETVTTESGARYVETCVTLAFWENGPICVDRSELADVTMYISEGRRKRILKTGLHIVMAPVCHGSPV
jgi:hypothetical protein